MQKSRTHGEQAVLFSAAKIIPRAKLVTLHEDGADRCNKGRAGHPSGTTADIASNYWIAVCSAPAPLCGWAQNVALKLSTAITHSVSECAHDA